MLLPDIYVLACYLGHGHRGRSGERVEKECWNRKTLAAPTVRGVRPWNSRAVEAAKLSVAFFRGWRKAPSSPLRCVRSLEIQQSQIQEYAIVRVAVTTGDSTAETCDFSSILVCATLRPGSGRV